MKAEIEGGGFVATVEEPKRKGEEYRTSIRMKDSSGWSLNLGEQDLKDLAQVSRMGRLMEGVGGIMGALASAEGMRQTGQPWSVSESATREYTQGRFGITVEKLRVENERPQYDATLSADGKPSLSATEQDVQDLWRLSTMTSDLVENHKQGGSVQEWMRQHEGEVSLERSQEQKQERNQEQMLTPRM